MTDHSKPSPNEKGHPVDLQGLAVTIEGLMKSTLLSVFATLVLIGTCTARELPEALPDAPSSSMLPGTFMVEAATRVPAMPKAVETKPIDAKFISLALISTGSTFADSYTTLFARQNWLAGKKGVCNMEVESPYLYGRHPAAGRVYAVASAKSAGSALAAYYLRKHHSKFWSAPLVANSIVSLQGVTQNMIACN
jgi:hypothetical protein